MKKATLIFLINPETQRICLGMKKRGFGVNKWNGFGGKVSEEEGIEQAAIRELQEEANVNITLQNLEKVGVMKFTFTDKPDWGQEVHIFLVRKWENEPTESEEMRPQWFKYAEVPYQLMWADDAVWLPKVLAGEKLTGEFSFTGEVLNGYKLSN